MEILLFFLLLQNLSFQSSPDYTPFQKHKRSADRFPKEAIVSGYDVSLLLFFISHEAFSEFIPLFPLQLSYLLSQFLFPINFFPFLF